jgi:hypothetical protein
VHNSDSFIEEVSEAVRRDRLTGFLRRYGWAIGALIVLLVDGAAALLEQVAGDGGTSPVFRSLASLEKVMVMGAKMDPGERAATLELLVAPGAPFRPLGLEQRALMQLEKGDKAAAQADLQAILTDPNSTQALQGRARQLIIASGGSVEEPAAPAAPMPADG